MDQIVRPSRSEVEAAFRTIIRWTGDDPDRDGLAETPSRMARAYEEYFKGYAEDPEAILSKTFEETEGYDEMIVLRGIRFESHCEHHMAPIIGRAWVAYIPDGRVVGISKLARIVEAYAKRLQIQEKMTAQIANAIDKVLQSQGVGVVWQRTTRRCVIAFVQVAISAGLVLRWTVACLPRVLMSQKPLSRYRAFFDRTTQGSSTADFIGRSREI